jgi:hypothetical protein
MDVKKFLLSKKAFFVIIPILIILITLAIVLPWPSTSQVAGTMGSGDDGVQRAQKYRANQMTEADVVLKNPEFQQIVQSDAFQKLLKNEEFVKFASSGNLSNLAANGLLNLGSNQNFTALLNQQSFAALCKNETFQQVVGFTSFLNVIYDKNLVNAIAKGQLDKVQESGLFKNFMNSPELAQKNLQMGQILFLMKSEDLKNVVTSQSFYALANNQMFYSFLKSGNLGAFPYGVTMQNMNAAGLTNLYNQQNFVSLTMSKEFMNMAKDGSLQMLSNNMQ